MKSSAIGKWAVVIAILFLVSCKKTEPLPQAGAPAASAPLPSCAAPASWFPSTQTQEPDPNTFPGADSATNCDFHQWSWQMFMWLTQKVGGDLRFMTFPSGDDLFKNPAKLPLAAAAIPQHRLMTLRPRSVEPKEANGFANPDAIAQAGSGAVLVGPNGRAVYYSVHFDKTFYEFVRTNKYYDYDTYVKADSTTDFPPGSLEIKASWRILSTGEDTSGIYTTMALVPALRDSAGSLYIDNAKPLLKERVALCGVHVVGVVAHHPEFIWATFEDKSNAPDLPPGVGAFDNKPVSAKGYTFYKANTFADSCNQMPASYSLNAATQVISPVSQVFRLFAWGGGSDTNVHNITMLNESVHQQLEAGSMLKNYDLIGAVWLLPGALHPNMRPKGGDLHGSPHLANSTMETYVQDSSTECFSCHTTTRSMTSTKLPIPAKNMNLSHILTDGLVKRELQLIKLHLKK